ncbi:putative A/G-specific adenine glycosylase YfhQ [compost metagenome]
MEESLPVKKKAKPPRPEHRVVAFIEGTGENEGKWLIRQRPQEGLLARMWELPHIEWTSLEWGADDKHGEELRSSLVQTEGIDVSPHNWAMDADHIFSHIHWHMKVYRCRMDDKNHSGAWIPFHYRWIDKDDVENYAFPNVFLKIMQSLANVSL